MLEIVNTMDNMIELKKMQKKLERKKVGWILKTEFEKDKAFMYNTDTCRVFVDLIEEIK